MEAVPPQDNAFDFTRLTRQLELNAEVLMDAMSKHAYDESEKVSDDIRMIQVKIMYLEAMLETLMEKVTAIEEKQ